MKNKKVHPERILFAIIAPLVFGGGALAGIGACIKNRGILKTGFEALILGGVISAIPLLGTLIYLGWKRISKTFDNDQNPN